MQTILSPPSSNRENTQLYYVTKDVLAEILQYCNVKELIRIRCVSRFPFNLSWFPSVWNASEYRIRFHPGINAGLTPSYNTHLRYNLSLNYINQIGQQLKLIDSLIIAAEQGFTNAFRPLDSIRLLKQSFVERKWCGMSVEKFDI